MLKLNKKRADSMIISYVLLISLAIAIAGLAYSWLRFQADISEPESCPEGVSIHILDYFYNNPLTKFNLSIKNRGRFSIDGFFVLINNDTKFESGIYNIGKFENKLEPDKEMFLSFKNQEEGINISIYNKICFIEVRPFVYSSKNEMIVCSQKATKRLSC